MSTRRHRKLGLKKETLRRLDADQMGAVAGGWTVTQRCGGDRQQVGQSGGCNTSGLNDQNQDDQVNLAGYFYYVNGG